MKVLLTGARGFIGQNLKKYLEDKGHEVIPFQGDIRNASDIDENFKHYEFEAVIHLAAYGNDSYHDQNSSLGKTIAWDTNVIGTMALFKRFLDSFSRIFIHTGSSSEYGVQDEPMSIHTRLDGTTPYARTKAFVSRALSNFQDTGKFVKTLRLFSVYGPHEKNNRLIPTAFRCAMGEESMPIAEGVHDFVYIEDVCRAYEKLLLEPKETPQVSHAASGIQYENEAVIGLIESITGKKIKTFKSEQMRPFDTTKSWVSDPESILVKPNYSLQEGLEETWKFLQSQS